MKTLSIYSRLLLFLVSIIFSHFAFSQSLTISAPIGTEERKFSETIDIVWENSSVVSSDRFYYYYSVDGGSFVNIGTLLHSQLSNDVNQSTYTWIIPDLGSDLESQVRVRVWNQTQNLSDTSEAFRVYYEPDVAITSPAGIEEKKFSESIPISWTNADVKSSDRFYYYYSVDGGSFVNIGTLLHSQLTNDGNSSTLNWTIPDLGSDLESQVRVRVWNQTRDVSDTSESFRVYYEPDVAITSPAGIEEKKFSESIPISWTNADVKSSDRFYYYYSVDGGSFVNIGTLLHSQLTNDGNSSTLNWTIPDLGSDLESQVRVRVWNQTRDVSDTSESFRVYYEPDVAITSPAGIEEKKFSESISISWTNADVKSSDRFYYYYSVDGGSFVNIGTLLHSQLTNDGNSSTLNWTIPDLGSDLESQVRVRVWNQTRNVSDTSQSFRVYYEPSVNITSPENGEFIEPGSQINIAWTNTDVKSSDRFYYYYNVDGGSFVNIGTLLHSQLSNDGNSSTLLWNTPNVESTNVKVRAWNQTRNVDDTTKSFVLCSTCPAISIYEPNGGEIYAAGQTAQIGWSLGTSAVWEPTDNIVIEFSQDGGATFETPVIYDGVYDPIATNQIALPVPEVITDQGVIRITNTTTGDTDLSNGVFEIQSATLNTPTEFFILENANGSLSLNWTDNEVAESGYRVDYSSDNITWTTYSAIQPANTQSYNTGSLTLNTAYWWRVLAVNDVASSPSISKYAGNITPPGNALSFDGLDDYVALADPESFNFGTGDFTMEAWFKTPALSGTVVIISDFNGTTSGSMGLALQEDGSLAAFIGSNTFDINTNAGVIAANRWYHVALVRAVDSAFIYVNGNRQAAIDGIDSRNLTSTLNMSLGYQPSGSPFYFAGEMDETRFWNVARTEQQLLTSLYTELNGNESGLVSYYKFDQPQGSTVLPDRTVNNLNATIVTEASNPQWVNSSAMSESIVTLTVGTPNGGESFTAGDEVEITWAGDNILDADGIEIRLSTDGGENYAILNDGTFGLYEGSYLWTVPSIPTSQALIQVANLTADVADESNSVFTIEAFSENRALSLASTQYVQIPDAPAFDIDSDFTIEAWVKSAGGGQQGIVTQGLNAGNGYSFFTVGNTLYFQYYSGGAYRNSTTALGFFINGLADGNWHHVAVSFNGAKGNLYYDGNLVQTKSTMLPVDESTSHIHLGYHPNVGQFNGSLDEVRFWSYARTAAEISANANAELAGTEPGLLAYYNFNEGSGLEIGDSTATGNDGTIVNAETGVFDNGPMLPDMSVVSPVIVVASPNGQETLQAGASQTIRWFDAGFDEGNLIEILFSSDGGESYSILNDGTFATYPDNTYSWTVPQTGTSQGRIKLVNTSTGLTDSSDYNFTIAVPQASVTVGFPNGGGGQLFNAGQEVTITWTEENVDPEDSIYIHLSTDGGQLFNTVVAKGTVDSFGGSYLWTVPEIGTCCALIQVSNTTKEVLDRSNGGFAIVATPAVTVVSPNGGEVWEGGAQYVVSWDPVSFGGADIVEVELSTDGGVNFTSLVSGNFNSQTTVSLPQVNTTNAIIRVTNIQKEVTDTSDEPFTIQTIDRNITVTSPNGGETWQGGTVQTLSWTTENIDENDFIEIRLSTNGGQSYFIIHDGRFSSFPENSFQWNVLNQPTQQALISVVNTSRSNVLDVSDAVFTILPAADITAPGFNSQPLVSIGNQDYDITVNLNEAGTVYFVALEDGSNIPTANQIKEAITSEIPLDNQVVSGSFAYQSPNTAQSIEGTGPFVINNLYDFYFTAEDAEENLNEGYARSNVLAIRVLTPLEQDSVILRAMYDQMDGENWTDIVNDWTESPITDWEEIEIAEGRVTAIDLAGRGLKNGLPENFAQMNALVDLDLSGNQISFVPGLASIETLTNADVRNNRLTFAHILPNLQVSGFQYDPQRRFGEPVDDTIPAGNNYSLTAPFMGSGVVYQWQFGPLIPGKAVNDNVAPIEGAQTQNYLIQSIDAQKQGTYRLRATHPSVEGFAVESRNRNIMGKTDLFGSINNDGNPLTSGEVFIYRQTPEGPFVKEDSTTVSTNGSYNLRDVVLGNFIVQVKPDRSLSENETALQTYYESAESYDEADTLVLDSRKEGIDIDLLFYEPFEKVPTGAQIAGFLESEFEEDTVTEEGNRVTSRRKVRKAGCSMRRFKSTGRPTQEAETEIAYYLETDDEGYFNFDGVAPGRYLINIEFPGVPMDNSSEVEFVVSENKENQVFEVTALITELGIVIEQEEILFNWKPYLKDILIYPNPTDGLLGMDYTVYRSLENLNALVYDVQGKLLNQTTIDHRQGRRHMDLNMTDYGSGVYHLILTDGSGSFRQEIKIIRK